MPPKHLQRYVNKFVGQHDLRPLGAESQMASVARGMVRKRLTYDELTAGPSPVAPGDPF